MKEYQGAQRPVIENIYPKVACGQFPARRTLGEPLSIRATVFTDGHDLLQVEAWIKPMKARKWHRYPMLPTGNDEWAGELVLNESGHYEYTVVSWIDHYESWLDGFKKKAAADQPLEVELKIGQSLAENNLKHLSAKDASRLKKHVDHWKKLNQQPAQQYAEHEELRELIGRAQAETTLVRRSEDTLKLVVERKRARFSNWYEFFPRSASTEPGQHGTFKDCERLLPRLADMGFNILYFPPIHPIGRNNRKGKNNSLSAEAEDVGSPWAIGAKEGGHKAIHPALGTLKDFKSLLKKADKLGIEVALDYALQCAPDHPYVNEHPEWFLWRPDGSVQYAENPPKKYQDVLPFNFECDDWQNLWGELKSITDYWIAQGVRVFRVDNPHTKPLHFWEWLISETHRTHPDIIFLAEAFTRPRIMERLGKIGFTQSYTYFTWRTTKHEIQEYLNELVHSPVREYFRPNFWPNTPDILPPHLTYGGEAAHIQRLLLAGTLSSNWGVYGPVYEFGLTRPMPNKEEYADNEKYELKHWDWRVETRIGKYMKVLNKLRNKYDALQYTHNVHFSDTDNDQLLAYQKLSVEGNHSLFCVANLDSRWTHSGMVKVPLHLLNLPADSSYTVHDLLSGEKYAWQGEWNYVKLDPNQQPMHIFCLENSDGSPLGRGKT